MNESTPSKPEPQEASPVSHGSAKFRCYVCAAPEVVMVWALNEDADRGFFCCAQCAGRLDKHFARSLSPNDQAHRRGRLGASELTTAVARPRSVQRVLDGERTNMLTPRQLDDIGQRIYWAVEHGRAGEVISELQAVQDDALREAAKIARHAGIYASDHPGCGCAADAIMRVVEPSNAAISDSPTEALTEGEK